MSSLAAAAVDRETDTDSCDMAELALSVKSCPDIQCRRSKRKHTKAVERDGDGGRSEECAEVAQHSTARLMCCCPHKTRNTKGSCDRRI